MGKARELIKDHSDILIPCVVVSGYICVKVIKHINETIKLKKLLNKIES